MYANQSSAQHDRRAEAAWELPAPTQSRHEELVLMYHDDDTKHLFFNPVTDEYRIVGCAADGDMPISGHLDVPEEYRGEVHYLLDKLCYLAPPGLPSDDEGSTRCQLFVFEGWLFAWRYHAQLRRWKIAPLTRL